MPEANAQRRIDGQPVIAHRFAGEDALAAWLVSLGDPLTCEAPLDLQGAGPGLIVTYDGVRFEAMGLTAFFLRHVNVAPEV